MNHLMQFGKETNWNSAVPFGRSVLLVKNDGTLWRWSGPTNFDSNHQHWPGLRAFAPHQLGTESNWAEVFQYDYFPYLRKTDGSIWAWGRGDWNTNQSKQIILEPELVVQSVEVPGLGKFRSMADVSYRGLFYKVGIRGDGTLHIWAHLRSNDRSKYLLWEPTDLQIGTGTKWMAAAASGSKLVTLKDDGSLWLWGFPESPQNLDRDQQEQEFQSAQPVRLGTHSDWVAIAGRGGSIVSLAADGSLWYWPLEHPGYYFHYHDGVMSKEFEPLLDIPRNPQFLANIFSNANN